jgi:hypothetical protein
MGSLTQAAGAAKAVHTERMRHSLLVALLAIAAASSWGSVATAPALSAIQGMSAEQWHEGSASGSPAAAGAQLPSVGNMAEVPAERWLRRAYAVAGARAGFGDYLVDNVDVPSLQETWAAISILPALPPTSQGKPSLTVEWIDSLRLPDGLYDDPTTEAPVLLETSWALGILNALGAEPETCDATLATLVAAADECTQKLDGEGHGSGSGTLGELSLIMHSIELLRGNTFLTGDASLARVRRTVSGLLVAALQDEQELSADAREDAWTWQLTLLVAKTHEAKSPELVRKALTQHLQRISSWPSGFVAEQQLLDLVDVSGRVFGWAALPLDVHALITGYLAATALAMPPSGAYEWSFEEWSWVDPALNTARAHLYALVGEEALGHEAIAEAMDGLRCARGWSTLVEALPSIDFTYFGTRLALRYGAQFVDYGRVAEYARSSLADPEATAQDLLYGARTLLALASFSAEDRAGVDARIAALGEDAVNADSYWLAPLLIEANIVPSGATRNALESAFDEFLPSLSEPQIGSLRLLAQLFTLLGKPSDDVLTDILRAAHSLAVPGAGFRWTSAAPLADLASTYCAVELFATVGRPDELDVGTLREFVQSCWVAPGFRLLRASDDPSGEEAYVDLFTTYMGVQVLSILGEADP